MKWDQRPGREPDDTWNYDRTQQDVQQDEQPTMVIRRPALVKHCRGPNCDALLWRRAARKYCAACTKLWKLRNAVAAGELSDWDNVHHVVGLTQYPSAFSADSDFDDAVWVAMFRASWCPWNWGARWDDPEED